MKKLLISAFVLFAPYAAWAGNVTSYPNVSSVTGSDIFFDWQSSTQQNCTGAQLKTYLLGGGTLSIGTGKTLTSSNTLTFAGTDGSSVNFGAGGTVLYSLGIGSSTQAWSAKLDALAALASPGANGYVLSATTGGTLSWVSNGTPNATTSGTNTYTATPSPALTAYTAGLIVTIRFANANTAGSSLNLNGLGAVTIQKNGAAIASGQIPASATMSLIYDGTNFQLINSGSVVVSGSQNITAISGLTTNGLVTTSGGTGTLGVTLTSALTATGDVTGTLGATTVVALNGTNLAGLSTGLLKNTTSTGVPVIATPGTDYIAPHTAGSPAIAGGAGAGTAPTVSVSGSDVAGLISLTTGSSPGTAGTVATVTFNTAFGATPNAVILTPANAATAALTAARPFVSSISTANFVFTSNGSALTGATAYAWYYFVPSQ